VSGGQAPNAIERLALGDDDLSINSDSRRTSLNTTISSSSNPQADCKGTRAVELFKDDTFVTEIAHSKKVGGSLKRKTRSIWGGSGKLSIF
jgi:hypothetical protein